MNYDEFWKRFQRLEQGFDKMIVETIEEMEEFLLDLNRSQISVGLTSKGEPIKPTYTEAYADKKGFNVPNLKVTGEFLKSIELKVTIKELDVSSELEMPHGHNLGESIEAKYAFIYGWNVQLQNIAYAEFGKLITNKIKNVLQL